MKSIVSKSLLGAVLATGAFFLLPVETAHAQAALALEVSIESATLDSKTGEVTVIGTATCSEPAAGYIYVELIQAAGRKESVYGYANDDISCDPDGDDFVLSVFPSDGFFTTRGIVVISGSANACSIRDPYYCGYVDFRESVDVTK